jgi:hypothetical protein
MNAIESAVRLVYRAHEYDLTSPWYFPTPAEYANVLEPAGFEVQYARLIDRPTPLEDELGSWLRMFANELLKD